MVYLVHGQSSTLAPCYYLKCVGGLESIGANRSRCRGIHAVQQANFNKFPPILFFSFREKSAKVIQYM